MNQIDRPVNANSTIHGLNFEYLRCGVNTGISANLEGELQFPRTKLRTLTIYTVSCSVSYGAGILHDIETRDN
jgi:hypothetical protein